MNEAELRSNVIDVDQAFEQMIWRVLSRYAELAGAQPAFDSATAYGR